MVVYMYGLEKMNDSHYVIHLEDGDTLEITVSDGSIDEEMTKKGRFTEETVTKSELSSELKSFIRGRTGLDWEN